MTTMETEEKKMPEGIEEIEKKGETPTDDNVPSVEEDSSKRPDYLQAVIESKIKDILGRKQREPIWKVLDDPAVKAIAERRAFLKESQQKALLARYEQEQQQRLKEMQMLRQQRREQRLEELQRPLEVRPGFLSRVTNFFKERTGNVVESLNQPDPHRELERINRQLKRKSLEGEVFKEKGARLRGSSGFLRGVVAGAFKGAGGISTRIGERLETKPKVPKYSGVPAPKPPGAL